MPNILDALLATIIARATSEIADAVRDNMADEVLRAVEAQAPAARAVPTAPKVSRKPKAASAPAVPAKGRQGNNAGDALDLVLAVIANNPGVRTEQIYAEAGLPVKAVKKALTKLRASGAVRTVGVKRGATYHVAGPAPAAAPKRAGKPAKATTPTGKKPRSDRSFSDADIAKVLDLIRSKPGLRPSQYQAASKLAPNVFERLVANLKETQRIRVMGAGRNTSYVAG